MHVTKFTWPYGDISLFDRRNGDSYKVKADGTPIQIMYNQSTRRYKYKRITTKKGLAHVAALLEIAEERNPQVTA